MQNIYYNRNGEPIDGITWTTLFEDARYSLLKRTTITSTTDLTRALDVFTMWLGINRNWNMALRPLIFETVIFDSNNDSLDCYQYLTEKDALIGHQEIVTVMASTMDDPTVVDVTANTIKEFVAHQGDEER